MIDTQPQHVTGREYWRSLNELANTPEFQDKLQHEFVQYDPDELLGMSRRRFVQLMGASMALAGVSLAGCRRYPEEHIAPFASRPDGRTPGVSERYATGMNLGGVAAGLLVSQYDGRPIKIEGNPLHPINKGASSALAQASVLEMYDPERSRFCVQNGTESNWQAFINFAAKHFGDLDATQGEGFAILSEATSSKAVAKLKKQLKTRFPKATWSTYEPINRSSTEQGTKLAFGTTLRPQWQLAAAKLIIGFDSDLFDGHPMQIKATRDWASGRRTADQGKMNRMIVAESTYSAMGVAADYRKPLRPAEIAQVIAALASKLGVAGVSLNGSLSEKLSKFVDMLAAEIKTAGPSAVIIPGDSLDATANAICHRINATLGSIGKTVIYTDEPLVDDADTDLATLTKAMTDGKVNTLLILGGNPVYNAPVDLNFAAALGKVKTSIHLSGYRDETSVLSTWHLPHAHYLESWGDGLAWDGTHTISQPMIRPLFDGKSIAQVLTLLLGGKESDGLVITRAAVGSGDDLSWRKVLASGIVEGSAFKAISRKPASNTLSVAVTPSQGFDLVFTASGVHDGRFANNAWLLEAPDMLTKVTWDNPALINVNDAEAGHIKTGDMIEISVGGKRMETVAYLMPGQPAGVMTLPLGYGRTESGHVGKGVGFDTYVLRSSDAMSCVSGASVASLKRKYDLAMTQEHHLIDHIGMEGREERVGKKGEMGEIVREIRLNDYKNDKMIVHRSEHGVALQLFEPPMEFNDPHAWGMAIDMNTCIGCNACVIACQAENNVPVVGKEMVKMGREMHWLRVDTYFKGDPFTDESPDVVTQPMMCMHCENAPCEQVCPVAATVHDSEGLNTMVYNRCIGTRYCSNNCPYKVRRFNYFDYHAKDVRDAEPENWLDIPDQQQGKSIDPFKQMVFNPDVTVRMRGVMEKCTYCVQRISAAKIPARNEGRLVKDGEIKTACQQACSTDAIVFGNLNDPAARVTMVHKNNRAYSVLGELNVKPRTKYLAKVRNPVTSEVHG
jgi:molybdopterin-containing oxidoreductase family iron-sulfur binding subunit